MSALPMKELGRTGLRVTVLGYGAMELRGAPRGREIKAEEAAAVLNGVLDAGINYIDTSIDYGQSEEIIGRSIARRRAEYYLATKCGCMAVPAPSGTPVHSRGGGPHFFTRENIVAGVHQSLARMKTDHVDVLQFHASPPKKMLEDNDAIETVLHLKKEGKIRFIGMSSTLPELPDHIEMGVFDVFQIPYSALQREHEELISRAARAGAGIVVRGAVARGAPSETKQKGEAWDLWRQAGLDGLLGGMGRMEFMLRFTISHPDLHTAIVGTINLDHLHENLRALEKGPLPPDLYAEATRRLASAGA
jgi:aryl-alcohol dehydrogenase-like predicted oxidoreductase